MSVITYAFLCVGGWPGVGPSGPEAPEWSGPGRWARVTAPGAPPPVADPVFDFLGSRVENGLGLVGVPLPKRRELFLLTLSQS